MSGRWQRHFTWSQEPQENTLPCVWWGNPLTPYKHCHMDWREQLGSAGKNWGYSPSKFNPSANTSGHPSKVAQLVGSGYALYMHAMPSHHWPCNASWEHFTSHNIYYMSHTIDNWNLYCSYTIKCIFAGIRISQFDRAKQNRTTAPLFQRNADENQEC